MTTHLQGERNDLEYCVTARATPAKFHLARNNMSPFSVDKGLRKSATGPGARWVKADFHVHLPGSSDYEYRGDDAFERLGQVIRDHGYAFAVVLKHQEFPTREELAKLQAHCPETTLIPGAEINVIVDALSKKVGKDYFCHCIVAVDPQQDGDYGHVLRNARTALSYRDGEYPAGFRSSILDVARFFRKCGAIFIPAHLHQAKGPDVSRSIDDLYEDDAFLGFVSENVFHALEVRQVSTAAFFDGSKSTTNGLPIPAAVCVASSDAHHHDHITERQRATWLRVEKPTFGELVAALSFPHRVSLTEPLSKHARIIGVHVVGAFIPECWLNLNEGLNALIGAKGSGKTALLECLRFALNSSVPTDRAESVNRHVSHVLGPSGYVECLIAHDDGTQELITRRADSPDRIVIASINGETRAITPAGGMPLEVSILGWHEIEAVADKPEARIALLDRIGEPGAIRALYDELHDTIEKARDLFPALQTKIRRLDASLRELWDLQRKRNTLTRLAEGELLELQRRYEWFLQTEQQLQGLRSDLAARNASLEETVASHIKTDLRPMSGVEELTTIAGALAAVIVALEANASAEASSVESLRSALKGIDEATSTAGTQLTVAFASFRDNTYTPKVNQLDPAERDILTKQIQVLEETKRLPLAQKECSSLLGEVKFLATQLRQLCQQVCARRAEVVAKRITLVDALNADIDSVTLRFLRSADKEARNRFQSRHAEEGAAFIGYLQTFGNPDAYDNLVACFENLESLRIDEDHWRVDKMLWDIRFIDLLDVADDDDVEIALLVGRAGYVPLQNLSAGQRCVAVFPLLLRNTRGPLIIDQPEDNLDNRYIADAIAPDLLRRKQNQQFLVTSHNANLVVLTDADLIVHVDSDGATCHIPVAGFLAWASSNVRQSVLDVLDGGETALAARQRKYGTMA